MSHHFVTHLMSRHWVTDAKLLTIYSRVATFNFWPWRLPTIHSIILLVTSANPLRSNSCPTRSVPLPRRIGIGFQGVSHSSQSRSHVTHLMSLISCLNIKSLSLASRDKKWVKQRVYQRVQKREFTETIGSESVNHMSLITFHSSHVTHLMSHHYVTHLMPLNSCLDLLSFISSLDLMSLITCDSSHVLSLRHSSHVSSLRHSSHVSLLRHWF